MGDDSDDTAGKNAYEQWLAAYNIHLPEDKNRLNRSGVEIKPLYTPDDWDSDKYDQDLGFPGQSPWTRGIYPTMHRGKAWSQRQLIGLATPRLYNLRMRKIVAAGANALSLIPCNSVYRGFDIDQVDPLLLGTCGTTVNTVDDMDVCLEDVPIDNMSVALNDPSPFTLLAFLLATANRRGISWDKITGTSNQSDYISHFVANHMFFRLELNGARRVFVDQVAYLNDNVPGWNPVSVVGQHMQQAGATPAEAMAFTLSTAIQYADDCIARGLDPDKFLRRFTFFFDISISFFEEVAKMRAGRRIWARVVRDRLGAKSEEAQRFKFHGQTSGMDLTRQQPLNNIARVTTQAIAGIFSGLQSMHTDSYDEALSTPTENAASIAIATQNILREEAYLSEVIDPLAGSYYIESLTNKMEDKIIQIMNQISDAGGMFEAVRLGMVQKMIGESAEKFQGQIDKGEQTLVGVNRYVSGDTELSVEPLERPDRDVMEKHLMAFKLFKKERSNEQVERALDGLTYAAEDENINLLQKVIEAAEAGATHGEICGRMRRDLGFGAPLVAA